MSQLTCPHCRNIFQLDLSVPDAQFGCPHCGGSVDCPTAPPTSQRVSQPEAAVTLAPYVSPEPPITEDPAAQHEPSAPLEPAGVQCASVAHEPPVLQPAVIDEPAAPPAAAISEPVVAEPMPLSSEPPAWPSAPGRASAAAILLDDSETQIDDRTLRHYASEEKASRRFVKNFMVWVICAIVMIVLMMVFLTD